MVSSVTDPEAGLATPAAMVASLAMTLVAGAVLLLALQTFRATSRHFDRTRLAYAISGAHSSALLTLTSSPEHSMVWRVETPVGPIQILAQPEAQKLPMGGDEKRLPDDLLRDLGAPDPTKAREQIVAGGTSKAQAVEALLGVVNSPAWRSCVRFFISPWGQSERVPSPETAVAPATSDQGGPAGSTWRIMVLGGGWVDERTVTLTGNPAQSVTRDRRPLYRSEGFPRCVRSGQTSP